MGAVSTDTPTDAAAPTTRRSRRAARATQPVLVADDQPVHGFDETTQAVAPVVVTAEPFELLEPPAEPIEAAAFIEAAGMFGAPEEAASDVADDFEAAARLFSFTGETPVQLDADLTAPVTDPAPAAPSHMPARRNRGASFKRLTATSFSVGVMGVVGLLTVGMTMPADAVAAATGTDITTAVAASAATDIQAGDKEIQAYVAPAEVQSVAITRDETYSTQTTAQLAADSGIANFSNYFFNDPNSPIQWPFAVGVPTSYGFGMRDGRMHEGADFTPGEGSPIQVIADGVVRESTDSGGAFGVHVVVDHIIDGQLISSTYSHMLYGSRQVQVGDQVTVGTVVGHTGNTGRSFGAHLHFELLAGGTTPIDPIPWLRAHAGG